MQDGSLAGYTVLLTDWLTSMFGIEIKPEIMSLPEMLENLSNGGIAFATLSATPERRQIYRMVDIAQRSIIMLRIVGSQPLNIIRQERLLRLVFTEGSVMADLAIEALEPGSYESFTVPNENAAYLALASGLADAFIATTNMEAAFDEYGDVYAEDFLPLIFLPAAMSAESPELQVIISLIERAMDNNAREHLADLYRQGYQDYRRHKFSILLTAEERQYMRENPVIPYATQFMAYPVSYYNTNTGEWQGIVFEVMEEIMSLTGMDFVLINDETIELAYVMNLLEEGTAHFMPNIILSPERLERFIFSSHMYLTDHFALISKRSLPNIDLNDIPHAKVGFARASAFTDMFRRWFPNATNAREYPTTDEAFAALDRGEVDLVMSSISRITGLTNYYELSDYKANYTFDTAFQATFGFNKEQEILRSIIDKALPMINTERIVQQWSSRTYSIEAMRLRAQRPYLISAIILTLIILFLVLILFIRNNLMASRLKTKIIEVNQAKLEAEIAGRVKNAFLANMSHELRTPLNSTINMIKEAIFTPEPKKGLDSLHQAVASSNDLLSVLNTILEISNIEAGELILSNSPFILGKTVLDINSLISGLCRAKGISWEPQVSFDSNIALEGDRIRLMQALTILLRNAVKFADEQNGKVIFVIDLLEESENTVSLRFSVRDNGIGMTVKKLEELELLFNPENKDIIYSSSEIMLTVSSNIVQAMGSRINIDSKLDEGSSFSFVLHLNKAIMPEVSKEIDISKLDFSGKRVLVVDDVAVNRRVLKNILIPRGADIIEAGDGKEALDIFLAEPGGIDMILMDIMMPNMDGYDATREIRSSGLPNSETIPIIAITSLSYKEDVEAAANAGMNHHLEKPVEPGLLLITLKRFLLDERV